MEGPGSKQLNCDAIGAWTFDRLMGNPLVDYAADALKRAKTKYADDLRKTHTKNKREGESG